MAFGVNAQEVPQCGKDVSQLSDEAERIKTAAAEAVVPEQSWGLLGQSLTYPDYVELTNAFMDHMNKMVKNMEQLGEKLSLTGKHYQGVDQAMSQALGDLGQQLSGVATPPKAGG